MKSSEFYQQSVKRAAVLTQLGRLADAVDLLEKLVERDPKHRRAIDMLVDAALQPQQVQRAIGQIERLIHDSPDDPDHRFRLGTLLRRTGNDAAALEAFQVAVELSPRQWQAWQQCGLILRDRGDLDSAKRALELALDIEPRSCRVHVELTKTLEALGDLLRAPLERRCVALLEKTPPVSPNWRHLAAEAQAYRQTGRLDCSVSCYHAALAVEPESALIYVQLSIVQRELGRNNGAIVSARQAVRIDPRSALAHTALAAPLVDASRFQEARDAVTRGIELEPNLADAHFHLGRIQFQCAEIDSAIASFNRALAINPRHRFAHSGVVFAMPYASGYTQRQIGILAREWVQRHISANGSNWSRRAAGSLRDRRLRVAYLSGDFRAHPMTHFVLPLLEHHERELFEIYCYSSVAQPDAHTERVRRHVDVFRDVANLPDGDVAARVRSDEIDILVDLSLHSGDQRLGVLAERAAPVQIVYLGYLGTTGLDAVQYRLTAPLLDDPALDGPDAHSEAPLNLPDAYWCYDPLQEELDPLPDPILPAQRVGYFTFGSQNSHPKLSEETLAVWARVLCAVPASRLLLTSPVDCQARTCLLLERHGVAATRLIWLPRRERREYLADFSKIDLCLDTVPYNGATTTLDAFWMGTPTLTLVGCTAVGRAGRHICMNLGLPELVARNSDEFVDKAVAFARDPNQLVKLRSDLRARLQASPLMTARRFVRGLEKAYRSAWENCCANIDSGSPRSAANSIHA